MRNIAIAFLLLLGAQQARAQGELREIRSGEAVTVRPDRAYFLFRVPQPSGVYAAEPMFMRVPTAAEMERYSAARRAAFAHAEPRLMREYQDRIRRPRSADQPQPERPSLENFNFSYTEIQNLDFVDRGRAFQRDRVERIYLVEAVPGDYVFYGLSYGGGGIGVCLCLGTVGFRADPGVITDLGYVISDIVYGVSSLPELRSESGFGPSSGDPRLLGATIRPARHDSTMPLGLRSLAVRPARFRAVGKFVEPRAHLINRLATVPGILDYREGRVIDVQSGMEVPDNY